MEDEDPGFRLVYALELLEAVGAGPLSFERLFLDEVSLEVELLELLELSELSELFSGGRWPFRP